jgi:hypothetical protein
VQFGIKIVHFHELPELQHGDVRMNAALVQLNDRSLRRRGNTRTTP